MSETAPIVVTLKEAAEALSGLMRAHIAKRGETVQKHAPPKVTERQLRYAAQQGFLRLAHSPLERGDTALIDGREAAVYWVFWVLAHVYGPRFAWAVLLFRGAEIRRGLALNVPRSVLQVRPENNRYQAEVLPEARADRAAETALQLWEVRSLVDGRLARARAGQSQLWVGWRRMPAAALEAEARQIAH